MKILCLGNEFIKEDSFAKKIGRNLSGDFNVLNVEDSFQLLSLLSKNSSEEMILVDVVENLNEVRFIEIEDLRMSSILSAHDFDAGYVLKLIDKDFKIIGIPMRGDKKKISEEVRRLIHDQLTFKK